jgi:hypothetical protein
VDDKVKAAIAGFNLGFGGYLFIRALGSVWGNLIIDMSWFMSQALIGLVLGAALAGIAYVVMAQMQK